MAVEQTFRLWPRLRWRYQKFLRTFCTFVFWSWLCIRRYAAQTLTRSYINDFFFLVAAEERRRHVWDIWHFRVRECAPIYNIFIQWMADRNELQTLAKDAHEAANTNTFARNCHCIDIILVRCLFLLLFKSSFHRSLSTHRTHMALINADLLGCCAAAWASLGAMLRVCILWHFI